MNLTIPIYVETIKSGGDAIVYQGRPLFFKEPVVRSEKLDRLMTRLAQDLGRQLTALGRENRHDALVPYTFYPRLAAHRLALTLSLRRSTLRGRFLFVVFRQFGRRIAFTPSVPELWFDISRTEVLRDRAIEVLTRHFREQEREDEDFDSASSVLTGTAYVAPLEIAIHPPAVPPEKPELHFLALGDTTAVDGADELRRVGRCLDWLYPDELDRVHLREAEVIELTRLLDAGENRPILLLGPRQVGKTALIHEYVHRQVSQRSSPYRDRRNVWLLAPARLISGMSYVGQWENRLLAILKEARRRQHVLYFDDLLGLFQAGRTSQSSLSVAGVLKPYLERREVRILGEITPEAWRVLREQDRGFSDLFHLIPVTEPNESDTLGMLIAVQRQLESMHRCRFDLEVLPTVIDLQRRFGRDIAFPGKAATFLRRVAIKHHAPTSGPGTESAERQVGTGPPQTISRADVLAEFHAQSGLSLTFLDRRARLGRQEVLAALAKEVIGQDAALQAAADVIAIAKARLNDPDRPLATFLFLGPTGVGKTQCAKAIGTYLFGDADRLLRFDLNEYGAPGAATRLVGTLGQPEGLLTSAIRRQPFAVILFDEVEKADAGVFDMLLQVLGEGRLTDALGRTTDFSNALILMTSNLGVREAEGQFGFRQDDAAQDAVFVQAAERFFRPEFVNRLDRVIPFRRLTRDHVGRIARKLIQDVFSREGLIQRKHIVGIEEEAMASIVERGHDPVLGARALKRSIERELTQPLACQLASQPPGSFTAVRIYAGLEQLIVHSQPLASAGREPSNDSIHQGTQAPRKSNLAELRQRVQMVVSRIEQETTPLRPAGAITLANVTPQQIRYFTLREQVERIRDALRRFGDEVERSLRPQHLPTYHRPDAVRKHRFVCAERPGAAILREMAAAMNINEYLNDLSESGVTPSPELLEEWDLCGQTALLQLMADSLRNALPDRVLLWLHGLNHEAESAVEELAKIELAALPFLQLDVEPRKVDGNLRPGQDRFLELQGIHAVPVAQSEVGTHLFCPLHKPIELVQVEAFPLPVGIDPNVVIASQVAQRTTWLQNLKQGRAALEEETWQFRPVVRVHDPHQIVDLRTGRITAGGGVQQFMLAVLPVPAELK